MVSVVIPTYNDDIRLNLVLWGLTRQTNRDFEVIVVNDGGNDDTKILVDTYSNAINISYAYLGPASEEYRPSKARNLGIKNSNYDRIVFIDCDVIPLDNLISTHSSKVTDDVIIVGVRSRIKPPRIKILTDLLERKKLNYNHVKHHVYVNDERLREERLSKSFLALTMADRMTWDYHTLIEHACLCSSANISYSKNVLLSLKGFNEDFTDILHGEDHDLAIRALKAGCGVLTKPESVVYHLDHEPRAKHNYPKMLELLSRARNS